MISVALFVEMSKPKETIANLALRQLTPARAESPNCFSELPACEYVNANRMVPATSVIPIMMTVPVSSDTAGPRRILALKFN